MSIRNWRLQETPYAIVDVETTGLNPGWDRIVELSIVTVVPSTGEVTLVFDSLINPLRTMGGTAIHGITPEMVSDAPSFAEIAAEAVVALSGNVLVAHNADFDMRFLKAEFQHLGICCDVPYLDTLPLWPALGLGKRQALESLLASIGIPLENAHMSGFDALGCGMIFQQCLAAANRLSILDFHTLAQRCEHRFTRSFAHQPIHSTSRRDLKVSGQQKSRAQQFGIEPNSLLPTVRQTSPAAVLYVDALLAALSDLRITDDEKEFLKHLQVLQELTPEQVKAIHAKAFVWKLSAMADDDWLDKTEEQTLRQLTQCLSTLGWAPGE